MSRYHWLNTSYDQAWPAGGGTLTNLDVVIPAHATMKRFVVRNTGIQGVGTGIGFDMVVNLFWLCSIDIVAGQYSPRNLFGTQRAIPAQVVALYDTPTTQRVYTHYVNAGDNELGINEKASYGLTTGGTFTVRLATSIHKQAGALSIISGRAQAEFKVLYYL